MGSNHACFDCAYMIQQGPPMTNTIGKPINYCGVGFVPDACRTCEKGEPYWTHWCPDGAMSIWKEEKLCRLTAKIVTVTGAMKRRFRRRTQPVTVVSFG